MPGTREGGLREEKISDKFSGYCRLPYLDALDNKRFFHPALDRPQFPAFALKRLYMRYRGIDDIGYVHIFASRLCLRVFGVAENPPFLNQRTFRTASPTLSRVCPKSRNVASIALF